MTQQKRRQHKNREAEHPGLALRRRTVRWRFRWRKIETTIYLAQPVILSNAIADFFLHQDAQASG